MKRKCFLRDWSEVKKLENVSCLGEEFTYLFFKELSPNKPQHRKINFKTITGIHYFEFKIRYDGVESRWKKMQKIAEHKDFIGWIPPTDKMVRKLKLKTLEQIS